MEVRLKHQERYNFDDFTHIHYREILESAKRKYIIASFTQRPDRGFCLLRHDVDYSLDASVALAEIEADKGCKSTYFLHLHNEFYNLSEKVSKHRVHELMEMGHEIAIHFDVHYYDIADTSQLIQALSFERTIMERLFGCEIGAFSFHNTNPFVLAHQEDEYAGLINTYAGRFQTEVGYCSDSNGFWRFDRMIEFLEAGHASVQLLTHPLWWSEHVDSPKEKIRKCIADRAVATQKYYDDSMLKFGRENIDWE